MKIGSGSWLVLFLMMCQRIWRWSQVFDRWRACLPAIAMCEIGLLCVFFQVLDDVVGFVEGVGGG